MRAPIAIILWSRRFGYARPPEVVVSGGLSANVWRQTVPDHV